MTKKEIILVVEDDKGLNNLIQATLDDLGFITEGVFTGRDAISRASKKDIKLMLLDYKLPDMNGKEVIERLSEKGCKVPFIVITGHGDEKVAVDMIKLGAGDYIDKEYDLLDLLPYSVEGVINELAITKEAAQIHEAGTAFGKKKLSFLKNKETFLNILEDISKSYIEPEFLFVGLIKSMIYTLDAKCEWTKGHSVRVVKSAEKIAENMGLGESHRKTLSLAGILHDIGKIGIYEPLLEKPGKLTREEFEIMKKHPVLGSAILDNIEQLREIVPAVKHHHEKFDGSGYPDGLKKEKIPLYARILHVADSFDAMTTVRPYRSSSGMEYAVSELKRYSGRQFDPDVVDAFMGVIDSSTL
jgi:putative nucleotidyltransferase with HDIG domain